MPAVITGVMPPTISAGDSDSDDECAARPDFMLSQSGTFKVSDFGLSKSGLSPKPPAESLEAAPGGPAVEAMHLDDLEMLEEIGSGASGSVRRARHRKTGDVVAVKQVQILDKKRREQAISELRIMRKHECPWLVRLYNAASSPRSRCRCSTASTTCTGRCTRCTAT